MGHWVVTRGLVETRHASAREAWAEAWGAYRLRSRLGAGGNVVMTLVYLGPGDNRPLPVRWSYTLQCREALW